MTAADCRMAEQITMLRDALRQTLDSMRALRGMAFQGSRIPVDRYPQFTAANTADAAATAALKATKL